MTKPDDAFGHTFTPAETAACCRLIEMALREDLGESPWLNFRDITTLIIVPPGYIGVANVVARKGGVVAGLPAMTLACGSLDPQLRFGPILQDGSKVEPGDVLGRLQGPMSSILGVERTALNFLQHLSGIATLTQRFVQAADGLPVTILDTRKTIPGWRLLAKYAVRQGGGHNHRMGLFDGILIKDNHLAFALPKFKSIAKLARMARREAYGIRADVKIEIEVDALDQLDEALPAAPDIILLDNMPLDMMREAVKRRNAVAPHIQLEASGGVTLDTVRAIAETGVDRISVGALTHSAPALDIGLDYET